VSKTVSLPFMRANFVNGKENILFKVYDHQIVQLFSLKEMGIFLGDVLKHPWGSPGFAA